MATISVPPAPDLVPLFPKRPAAVSLYLRFIDLGSPSPIFWASSYPLPLLTQPSGTHVWQPEGERKKRKGIPNRRRKSGNIFPTPLWPPSPLPAFPRSIPHLTSPARRRQGAAKQAGCSPSLCKLSSINHQCPFLLFASLPSFLLPLSFRPPDVDCAKRIFAGVRVRSLAPKFRVTGSSGHATPRGDGE